MTYYDPKIYNFKNLKDKDKLIVAGMFYQYLIAHEALKDYEEANETSQTLFQEMKNTNAVDTTKELIKKLGTEIIDYIVSTIDSYEEDVELVETKHYTEGVYDDPLVSWMFYRFDFEDDDE